MTDNVSQVQRSRMMSRIRQRDTAPELEVRRFLFGEGLRFRIHVRDLPGTPDIVLRKFSAVIFVNGCFWHRHRNCRFAYEPKTNKEFWFDKFDKNIERDKRTTTQLRSLGWRVFTVWTCNLGKRRLKQLARQISTGSIRN